MVRDWRKNVDPLIREHLESQIKATMNYKKAYENADNKGTAQLWIAIANLSKQTFNTSMKINYIEDLMKDVIKKIDELKEKREEIAFMEEPVVEELVIKKSKSNSRKKTKDKSKKGSKSRRSVQKRPNLRKSLKRF